MTNQTLADIRSRRSVKKYTDQPVPMELVEAVVEAGMYAPSGMNRQSAIILAVTNRELRDRLSRMNLDIVLAVSCRPPRAIAIRSMERRSCSWSWPARIVPPVSTMAPS